MSAAAERAGFHCPGFAFTETPSVAGRSDDLTPTPICYLHQDGAVSDCHHQDTQVKQLCYCKADPCFEIDVVYDGETIGETDALTKEECQAECLNDMSARCKYFTR